MSKIVLISKSVVIHCAACFGLLNSFKYFHNTDMTTITVSCKIQT